MVKVRSGNRWKALFCKHDWTHVLFEQYSPTSYRYLKMCKKCLIKELFATKDLEDVPWP